MYVATHAENDLFYAIQGAITAANREIEYVALGGLEGEAENPFDELEKILVAGLAQVRSTRNHAHDWADDDRCSVCGADGRA